MPPKPKTLPKSKPPPKTKPLPPLPSSSSIPTPALDSTTLRTSYRIAKGEQGVLTFEPYKSTLLAYWRFATPAAARESSQALLHFFDAYAAKHDFVGMDMARKFLQMGVTRARRYANYQGGRKYDRATGSQLDKGREFAGRSEKLLASEVFREVLEGVNLREEYSRARDAWAKEVQDWIERHGEESVDRRTGQVVSETEDGKGGKRGAGADGPRRSKRVKRA